MFDQFFIAITTFGNYILVAAVTLLLIRQYQRTRAIPKRELFILLTAFLIRTVTVEAIRKIYPVPRAFVAYHFTPLIMHEINGSFPSGHAATAFLLASYIYLKDKQSLRPDGLKTLGNFSVVIAILVAISRVYVGVHYAADVFAGAILGIGSVLLGKFLAKKIDKKEQIL